jgi:hypothetical protein
MISPLISDLLNLMESWQTRADSLGIALDAADDDEQRHFATGTTFAYMNAREELAALLARAVERGEPTGFAPTRN